MKQNKFRCHFSIVFENLGSAFWFIVMCFMTQIDDLAKIDWSQLHKGGEIADEVLYTGMVLLAVIFFVFLIQCIKWAKTWISIEEDAIVIERRTLKRISNTIGIKNISNINMEQNLFERLVGTYKIKLDTNSRTTADSTDVKIVLSKTQAVYFKEQIMLYMNEKNEKADEAKEEYDILYTVKDIILHCFYTASIASVLILTGTLIGCIVGIRSLRTGAFVVDSLVNVIGSVAAIIIILSSTLQGLVKDFFIYYGFRVARRENKIYLYHGLLKKRQYTLAVDKINAVQVISTTLSRLWKRQYVKVICIGVGDEKNEDSMLLLSASREDMYRKLSVLLPEFVLEEPKIRRREKASVLSDLPANIILFSILSAGVILMGVNHWFGISRFWIRVLIIIGCISVMLVNLIKIYMNFCTCGVGVGRDVLTLENGNFCKVTTWIPYSKIQQMEYKQGPVGRHFGFAAGTVFILADMVDSIHELTYVRLELFDEVHKKILMRNGNKNSE